VVKQLVLSTAVLCAVAAAAAAQAKDSDSGVKWSANAGVAVPVGDLANSSKMGFGIGAGAEWKLNAAWGVRADLGYTTFTGKSIDFFGTSIPLPSLNMLGLGVNFVHRDESRLSYSVGASYYNVGCSGCSNDSKPAVQVGLGWALDDARKWVLEGGVTNIFASGSNATWIPLGVRLNF